MILTEKDAMAKICPIIDIPEQYERCLASGCMAWRWFDSERDAEPGIGERPGSSRRGYCGLAGKVME